MFKLTEADIEFFRSLAIQGNELYDLEDEETKLTYEAARTAKAEVYARDTNSFIEIESCVKNATRHNRGDGIVFLRGAYTHMIGAISALAKSYNIVYVPIGEKISTQTLCWPSKTEFLTSEQLKVQMDRGIGVVKYLGFESMENLRAHLEGLKFSPKKRTLVVIASHDTGWHCIHAHLSRNQYHVDLFNKLTNFVIQQPQKPFVCRVEEDLYVDGARRSLDRALPGEYPFQAFFRQIHHAGCVVELGAFGLKDEQRFEGGVRRRERNRYHPPSHSVFFKTLSASEEIRTEALVEKMMAPYRGRRLNK